MTGTDNTTEISAREAVLEILTEGVEVTDAELVSRISYSHLHRGKIIPARIFLARKGLVELAHKNERGHQVWRLAPAERREEAAQDAADRKLSYADKVQKTNAEEQAQVVAAILEDATVNRLLREQNENALAMRRARARANESNQETEAQRRERKRQLKQAEREQAASLEFLKVRDMLRDGVGDLIAIRDLLTTELQRIEDGEQMRVSPDRWEAALVNVMEHLHLSGAIWEDATVASGHHPEHCPLCHSRIARDPNALEEGYLDGEVVEEVDEVELVD
jgi:hypothetical protein